MRIDLSGTTIAVIRHQEQLYAIQEFCTHRHGPLSEGCFENGQVQCPWHNSRFDLRTGKVAHGPAKMEIKVFETQIRDGQIWVRSTPTVGPLRPATAKQKGEISRTEAKSSPDQPTAQLPESQRQRS